MLQKQQKMMPILPYEKGKRKKKMQLKPNKLKKTPN